jgi:glycosyltransferase involved in cell wall biosynthesis
VSRPRVVYWNNIPSPYVVERFNALASRGNLEFEAWFNTRRERDRSWNVDEAEWRFRARYIPRRSVAARRLHLPLPELTNARPDLLISLYASPSFVLGSAAARACGSRIAYRVLPTFDEWVQRARWKELLKSLIFRSVDGVIVPGPDGASMAQRYGVPSERIRAVTQSVAVEHYARARDVEPTRRARRREEMGLHGCVFLYVGRLWSGKGLTYLFDAFRKVRGGRPNISLLLVGDGVHEASCQAVARGLPGVTFTGFVQPRDLPDYYALADALVFPTLGDPHGLVVEEAMAAGLPVICTEAAGDIHRRLPDGRAGYVVPPADSNQLGQRMDRLAADEDLRRRLAGEAERLVALRTHDRWAADIEAFVEHVMSLPRRRTPDALLAKLAGMAVLMGGRRDVSTSPVIGLGKEQAT